MDNRALQDHTLTYLNPYDLKIFTKEVKEKIDILQQYWITALAIERNAIYLKQDLIEEQQVSILGQILGKKKVMSEEKKEQIMENMLSLLENPEFLATFKEDGTD